MPLNHNVAATQIPFVSLGEFMVLRTPAKGQNW